MISLKADGDFSKTENFLNRLLKKQPGRTEFDRYGIRGVQLLSSATPIDSGRTASSWTYDIVDGDGVLKLQFKNTNINKGVNIAIILQYGHGTRNGGWVEGRDYINPAIQPLFDEMAEQAWEEVKKA